MKMSEIRRISRDTRAYMFVVGSEVGGTIGGKPCLHLLRLCSGVEVVYTIGARGVEHSHAIDIQHA